MTGEKAEIGVTDDEERVMAAGWAVVECLEQDRNSEQARLALQFLNKSLTCPEQRRLFGLPPFLRIA
jgi:hypothetical protein